MEPTFRRLVIWKKAHQLALDVATATQHFPETEIEGLALELRKNAVEVNGAIANGYGGAGRRHLQKHLERADHANYRLEVQLEVARDVGFLSEIEGEHLLASCAEVQRLLDRQLIGLQRKRTKR